MDVKINGVRYLPEAVSAIKTKPFHELIEVARKLKTETLQEAADGIGTSKAYLWELEQGGSQPTLPLLQKILSYYGLKFEQVKS